MRPTPHELLVEWHSLATQGAFVGTVCGEVPAYQAEDWPTIEIDRGAAPEAADAHDMGSQLLDQLDQEIERRAGGHQVLHQQDLRART